MTSRLKALSFRFQECYNSLDQPIYNRLLSKEGFIEKIWKEVFKYSKSNLVALSCVSKWFNESIRNYYKNYEPEGSFGMKE